MITRPPRMTALQSDKVHLVHAFLKDLAVCKKSLRVVSFTSIRSEATCRVCLGTYSPGGSVHAPARFTSRKSTLCGCGSIAQQWNNPHKFKISENTGEVTCTQCIKKLGLEDLRTEQQKIALEAKVERHYQRYIRGEK